MNTSHFWEIWKNLNFLKPLHEFFLNYPRSIWSKFQKKWENEFFNFWLFFGQNWSKFSKLYVSETWHEIANLFGLYLLGVVRLSMHVLLILDNLRADFTENLVVPSILKWLCKTSNWHYWWVGLVWEGVLWRYAVTTFILFPDIENNAWRLS